MARLAITMTFFLCVQSIGATSLSGAVLQRDSTAKSGVSISLSGSTLYATTDQNGAWTLSDASTSSVVSIKNTQQESGRLLFVDGHLQYSLGNYDLLGRSLGSSESVVSSTASTNNMLARWISVPDTLVYAWNGKVFLRDTITVLEQSGIIRYYDTTTNASATYGYLTDSRDSKLYRTVKIGYQTWMAQNLNYAPPNAPSFSRCNSSMPGYCDTYGRTYRWAYANMSCPVSWHLPQAAEWDALLTSVGGSAIAGNQLKSSTSWMNNTQGSDLYGFDALPVGKWNASSNLLTQFGTKAYWWTATDKDFNYAIALSLNSGTDVSIADAHNGDYLSVRCVQDLLALDSIPTKKASDPPFVVSAKTLEESTHGLPITYKASPSYICTNSGDTISIVGANGEVCRIEADLMDGNHVVSTAVKAFPVTAIPSTLTFTSPNPGIRFTADGDSFLYDFAVQTNSDGDVAIESATPDICTYSAAQGMVSFVNDRKSASLRTGQCTIRATVWNSPKYTSAHTEQSFLVLTDLLHDVRDNKLYSTVKIGTQTWMAENLNYQPDTGKSWCYHDNEANCGTYGRLYSFASAKSSCPSGWRVPDTAEWNVLTNYSGGSLAVAGILLKSATGWDTNTSANAYAFSALPGGFYNRSSFVDSSHAGYWRTATTNGQDGTYSLTIHGGDPYFNPVMVRSINDQNAGMSVRCLKNIPVSTSSTTTSSTTTSSTSSSSSSSATSSSSFARMNTQTCTYDPTAHTLACAEKTYKTTTIGTQTWMAENLNFIPAIGVSACNDGAGGAAANCATYGRLYDWVTAMTVCPVGWHLPDTTEWSTLYKAVNYNAIALKASSGWEGDSTKQGTDSYGFTALPGGVWSEAYFYDPGTLADWWTSTLADDNSRVAYEEWIGLQYPYVLASLNRSMNITIGYWLSVRCIQD